MAIPVSSQIAPFWNAQQQNGIDEELFKYEAENEKLVKMENTSMIT